MCLDADAVSRHPDLVVWRAGSNDSLRGMRTARFEAELKSGGDAIRAGGADILLMAPQWSSIIERADAKERIDEAVLAVDASVFTPRDLVGPCGLHMTDRRYGLLAQAVLDRIATDPPAFEARSTGAAPVRAAAP